MKKDIIVRTEKEFLKALEEIDENTLIIFDDGEPIKLEVEYPSRKIDAREYANYYNNRLKMLKFLKKRGDY